MRKFVHIFATFILILVCFLFSFTAYCCLKLPDCYRCFSNNFPKIRIFGLNLTKNLHHAPVNSNVSYSLVNKENYIAVLFGFFPVKQIEVQTLRERIYLSPCGIPFGLKIFTDGVLIVDLKKINTKSGEEFPAKKAGLKKGDFLVSVNGVKVTCNKQLKHIVASSKGRPMKFKVIRDSKKLDFNLFPVLSDKENIYRSGVMVRDSSAGIGTLTFTTQNGDFGGLGHAVFDVDTGTNLTIGKGDIVEAYIADVVHGNCSKPGELKGELESKSIGCIKANSDFGVYGKLKKPLKSFGLMPLGLKHEVEVGKAFIYSTLDGSKPKKYEVEIESIDLKHPTVKNFVVKVVDEKLINKSGGIVKGMSGSPVIQNGKLVGAITHVFVNDPTRGYGVFAETMFMTSKESAKKSG